MPLSPNDGRTGREHGGDGVGEAVGSFGATGLRVCTGPRVTGGSVCTGGSVMLMTGVGARVAAQSLICTQLPCPFGVCADGGGVAFAGQVP